MRLRGSKIPSDGPEAIRPTDNELDELLDIRDPAAIQNTVSKLLNRVGLRFGQE